MPRSVKIIRLIRNLQKDSYVFSPYQRSNGSLPRFLQVPHKSVSLGYRGGNTLQSKDGGVARRRNAAENLQKKKN